MIPILFDAKETEFKTNGLGRLSDAISCTVTEERNGQYELEMVYPVSGIHYKDICEYRYIYVVPAEDTNPQAFKIYKITKPFNRQVTIYAQHISYNLKKYTIKPFKASGIIKTFEAIADNIVGGSPFSFQTDRTTESEYNLKRPLSVRSFLGGTENSILDVFGTGDYEFDMFTVKFLAARGQDTGVTIRYGKNMTDLEAEVDVDNVCTACVPYYYTEDAAVIGDVVYSGHESEFDSPMILPLDVTSYFDTQTDSEGNPIIPTKAQVEEKGKKYLEKNKVWESDSSLTVSFINLWQTEEYKNVAPLQKVKMCDYVTVIHNELGVSEKMRVIKTVYDCLVDRYESIELGKPKTTLSDAIANSGEIANMNDVSNYTQQVSVNIINLTADVKVLKDKIDDLEERVKELEEKA